ncbi:MAG: hypothetical protein V4494_06735 [Chlamydiota bacterium]
MSVHCNSEVFGVFESRDQACTSLNHYISMVKQATNNAYSVAGLEYKENNIQPLAFTPWTFDQTDDLDCLFACTDLTVYPDDYANTLPSYGITKQEYEKVKTVFLSIINGRTPITIQKESKDFCQAIFLDLVILFSRTTSREFLFELIEQQQHVHIQKRAQGCCQDRGFFTNIIGMNLNTMMSMIAESPKGRLLVPLPRYIALVHEMLHFYLQCLHGYRIAQDLGKSSPTLDDAYDDANEQVVITGNGGGLIPDLPFNEHKICRDFNMLLRMDHRGVSTQPDIHGTFLTKKDWLTLVDGATSNGAILNIAQWLEDQGKINTIYKSVCKWNKKLKITPLENAAKNGYTNIVDLFLNHKATQQPVMERLLRNTVFSCDWNLARLLMARGASANMSNHDFNALFYAATADFTAYKAVKCFLDYGADVNTTHNGLTAFAQAANTTDSVMAMLLTKRGAPVNQPTLHGTILHELILTLKDDNDAPLHGFKELLALGADPKISNIDGETACYQIIKQAKPYIKDQKTYKKLLRRYKPILKWIQKKDPTAHLAKGTNGKSAYDYAREQQLDGMLAMFSQ